MHDHRRETRLVRAVRAGWFALMAIGALVAFGYAGSTFGDPTSPLHIYRGQPAPPRVHVYGTLWRTEHSPVAAMCVVRHERYEQCGKAKCWRTYESMRSAHAELVVESSSIPLPPRLALSPDFRVDPRWPTTDVVTGFTESTWRRIAQDANLGFANDTFGGPTRDRVTQSCLDEGQRVLIEGCVSSDGPARITPCEGSAFYGVAPDGPEAAYDAAADDLALHVALGFGAILLGVLGLLRAPAPLLVGLEDRAAPHRRRLGLAWALLAVPPVAGLVTLLMHASSVTSTWATGREGFALGVSVLALWILFAIGRALRRRRTLAALAPVLATARSPLAHATGVAELAVRARQRGEGHMALIGGERVAFSEVSISETYRSGKSTTTVPRGVFRASDELEVVDESGDGVLDLSQAILDVEHRKITMTDLSEPYAERGVVVEKHPNHVAYVVEERVVRDGEPLYVLGDVSRIEHRATGNGYRSVRGAPRLGGAGVPPVLVHAGSERGLVASLSAQARTAKSLAVVAVCASLALAGALAWLATF